MRVVVICAAVVFVAFFVVFSVHAHTPLQLEVKEFLDSGVGELPFSADANSHLRDVLALLSAARVVTALLVVALFALIPFLDAFSLRLAGSLLVFVPVGLSLVSWSWLFEVFHLVLFPQGNWRFPADSLLIQTYPQEFFVSFALWWGVLVVGSGLALVAGSYRLERCLHDFF